MHMQYADGQEQIMSTQVLAPIDMPTCERVGGLASWLAELLVGL